MRVRFRVTAMALALLPLLAACDNDPVGAEDEQPHFQATIQGAVQSGFNGTGEFLVNTNLRLAGVTEFTLNSEGRGASAGQRFLLFRRGAGLPEVGTHTIGTIDLQDADARGFTAVFSVAGDVTRYFTSSTGYLTITHSSPEVVRGVFAFTAFQYCQVDQHTGDTFGPCMIPPAVIAGAPTIEVSGGFVAHPMDPTVDPLN